MLSSLSRQYSRVSVPGKVVRGRQQGRGLGILLRLLTLVMAQQAIPMVGGVAATGAMWKTTTAAVGILLASQAAQAQSMDPPAKPTGFRLVERSGALILVWTDPGDSTITKWQYWLSTQNILPEDNDPGWQDVPGSTATTTSHKVTGLTNGRSYFSFLRAVNNNGISTRTDSGTTSTPKEARVPSANVAGVKMNTIRIVEGASQFVRIDLNAEPVGGDVEITVTGASGDISFNPSILTFTKDDWYERKKITVTVATDSDSVVDTATLSYSVMGPGDYSGVIISPTTVKSIDSQAVQEKPDTLYAFAGDEKVLLVWTNRYGYSPVIDHWEYRKKADGDTNYGSWQDVTSSTDHRARMETVSNLTNGTQYTFQVRAFDRQDRGGTPSDAVMATPTAAAAGVTVLPTNLTVGEGDQNIYRARLNKAPSASVTLTPSSSNTALATVSSALTFTTDNWDTLKTVTVTALHDVDTTDNTVTVSHTVSGSSDYNSVTAGDVTVTVDDDDPVAPGVTVIADREVELTEGGSAGSYTVVLDSQPTGDVMVTPNSSDTGAATVSAALTFTTSDWEDPQTVTVNPVDDDDATKESVTVTHAVTGASEYASLTANDVTVTVDDDDIRGVTATPVTVELTEGGSTGSYTVVLDTEPTGDVTVTPNSPDTGAARVSAALTFTNSDWETPQTVTVTPQDDGDYRNERVTVTHLVRGADYNSVNTDDPDSVDSVLVKVDDDEVKPEPVSPGGLRLVSRPGALILVWEDPDDSRITKYQYQLTGTSSWQDIPGSSATTTSYRLTETDDGSPLSNGATYGVKLRAVAGTTNGDASAEVTGSPNKNHVPGVTFGDDLSSSTTLYIHEGYSNSFPMSLTAEPATSDVTITVAGVSGDVSLAKSSLTFTKDNWQNDQRITVKADADADKVMDTVTLSYRAMGGDYDLVRIPSTIVKVIELDTFLEAPSLSAIAGSSEVTLIWTINQEVNIVAWEYRQKTSGEYNNWAEIPSSNTNTRTHTVSSLTDSTQYTFQVRAKKGIGAEGDTAPSNEAMATPIAASAGVTVFPTKLTLREDNRGNVSDGNYYRVRLNNDPSGTVAVTPSSSDPDVATVSSALEFTSSDWNTFKTVTVTTLHDGDTTDANITLTNVVSGATSYSSVTAESVAVTVKDDDLPPLGVTVSTADLTIKEGNTAIYTVVLDTVDIGDVTVTPSSSDTDAARVSSALTFAAANYNNPQTVTVTGVQDQDETDETVTVTHAVSSSRYDNVTAKDVTVMVEDDDNAGVTVSSTELSLTEGGSTGSYTVKLDKAPTANVVVTPTSPDTGAVAVSSALTFTATNWDTAQTVTVTPVDDDDATDETVTVTNTVSGTGDYASVTAKAVAVAITDDDEPGVTVVPENLELMEGGAAKSYTVVLDTIPSANVTVTPGSDDTDAVMLSVALIFTTSNWDTTQTVTVTPRDDEDETDETVTVTNTVSGTDDYASVTANDVTVKVEDDDGPGVIISTRNLELTEGGSTGSYTVKLNKVPTANVVVTPSSGDTDAATVSAALTFTSDNWDTTQTVTVTPVQDDDATIETVTVTNAISGASEYASLTADAVTVKVNDDGTRGVTVTPATVPLEEGGSTGSYTVVLDTEPTGDVMVTPTSSDTDAATVSAALTFTTGNWNTAQTVTVTPIDDNDIEDETVTVTNAVSGADYAGETVEEDVTAEDVTVTVNDDDSRGVIVDTDSVTANSQTAMTIVEGSTGTYTVKLASLPTGDVIVTPTSGNAAVTVSAALTFTTANYDTAQMVTVTAVEDDDANDPPAPFTLTHTVSGANYASGVTAASVTVTVTDDDPDVTVSSLSPATLTEGTTGTYTVRLKTTPEGGDVIVTPASPDDGAVTVSAALTFTTANWNTEQTVTVTAAEDDDTTDETVTVTNTASGANYDSVSKDVTVTVDDNDIPGVTITPTDGMITVNEGSSKDTYIYTVKLDTQPSDTVKVIPSSDDSDAVMVVNAVGGNVLNFTATNWDTAQTVKVTGVEDIDTTDETVTVTNDVVGTGDYASVTASSVTVKVNDDDKAGLTFEPAKRMITVEEGSIGTYTVKLNTSPTGDVIVTPASADGGAVTVSAALTFTPTNWNTEQVVTAMAVVDDDTTNESVMVTNTVSGPGGYASVTALAVTVDITDNSERGVTVSSEAIEIEEGSTASYAVELDTIPNGNVTVTPTSGDAAVMVSAALIFTSTNWDSAQMVTVTAVDDDDASDPRSSFTVTHTVSGGDYGSVTANSVEVTVRDDDESGVTVTPSDGILTVNEGSTATYTVELDTEPSGNVKVILNSGDNDAVTVSVSSGDTLTFTPTNWNTAQTVTVTSVDNEKAEPNDDVKVTNIVIGFGDYKDVRADSVMVKVNDDDAPGLTFDPANRMITLEEGSIGSYSVRLNTEPDGDVVVKPNLVTDTGPFGLSALSFTASNWDTAQTVMVPTNENKKDEEDRTLMISHVVTGYGDVEAADVTMTITDDDHSPVLAMIEDQSVVVNEQLSITATATDADGDTISYAWSRKEGETIPALPDGTALNEAELSFTPTVVGTYTMMVTASDGNGNSDEQEVLITVTGGPTISIADVSGAEGGSFSFTVSASETPSQDVTFQYTVTAESSDTATADTDFAAVATAMTGTIAAGEESTTIDVAVTDDDLDEGDETFTVSLSNPSGGFAIADATARGTITDDDHSPVLTTIPPQTGAVGTMFSVTATATDADGDTITYAWSRKEGETIPALPPGTALNEATLRFTPTAVGTYTMMVTAADGNGNSSDPQEVAITVSARPERSLSIADVSGAEGSSFTFTVSASEAPSQDVTFQYTVTAESGDTATADTDFTAVSTAMTGTIAAGEQSTTIAVAVTDDGLDEGDEAFTVSLSNPSGGFAIPDPTATGIITDDDHSPVLTTIPPQTGAVGTMFSVTATATDADGDTITYAWSRKEGETIPALPPGTALNEATLRFTPSAVGTYTMMVSAADGNGNSSDPQEVSITIFPGTRRSLSIADVSGAEDGRFTFTVMASEAPSQDVTFQYTVTAAGGDTATANTDFTAVSTAMTGTIAAGERSTTIEVAVADDGLDEGEETFTVSLSNPSGGFAIPDPTATGTITDDDNSPVLAMIDDQTGTVGTMFSVTASATDADGDIITYAWSRKEGETTPALPPGTALTEARLRFTPTAAGTYTMMVTAADPYGNSSDPQEVSITISPGTGRRLTIADVSAAEDGRFTFMVSASEAPSEDVTFQYTVIATRGDTATAGTDFTAVSTAMTGTIPAGALSTTIEVVVTDDDLDEGDETFTVSLSNPSGGFAIPDPTATGTITDDDNSPVLAMIDDQTGTVGTMFSVTATASDADGDTITYTWSRKDGETIPALPPGTALTEATLRFTPTAAGTYTMMVTAADPYGNSSNPQEVSITISPGTGRRLTIADVSAAEDGRFTFMVSASEAPSEDVTFQYTVIATRGDTATADTDFTAVTTAMTGTIAAGALSTTIEVAVTDDDLDEGDETFTVSLSNPSGGFAIPDPTATGTITDDDHSPVLVMIDDQTGMVGTMFSVTASASDADGDTITYQWSRKEGETTPALPDGTALNEAELSFTPTAVGTYTMTVTAADPYGNEDEQEVRITVSPRPATVSVPTALSVTEGTDESATVTITTTRPFGQEVTFNVTYGGTATGSATPSGMDDYDNDAVTSLTFGSTDTSKNIIIPLYDDSEVEENKTIVVTITPAAALPDGFILSNAAITVTITDDDDKEKAAQVEARKAELAGLSRATLGIATDMIGARVSGDLSGGGAGSGSLGDQALGVMENLLGFSHGSELSNNLSLEQLGEQLWSESFHISQSDSGSAQQDWDVIGEQQGRWSLWGAGELRSFKGDDDSEAEDHSYSGSMRAGWLGVDYQFPEAWLAGLALSFSSAESDYTYRSDGNLRSGKTETELTTFYPYGSVQLSERLRLWGAAGIGFGELRHQAGGATEEQEGELEVQLAAIGFEQQLSSLAAWHFALAGDLGIVKSSTEWEDGAGLEDQSVSITRARLGVNSSFPLSETTTGYLNLKGRLDGGDLQMGAAEMVLGLRYRTGRFSALLQGRQTYSFDGNYSESGLLGELRFSSQQDGTGLALQLQPSYGPYGEVGSEQASLWNDQQVDAITGWNGDGQQGGDMALKSTMGYGILLPDSNVLLTPFAEVAFTEGNHHQVGLGLSMEGYAWEVKLTGSREESSSTAPTGAVKLMFSKQL